MKEKLKVLIASKAARKNTETLREGIEKQLIEKVIFDVPASLLEKEANHRVSQLFNNPEFKKQWEEELSEEEKEARKVEIKEKATQAIRLFYLCRDIVNSNKISVGDADMKTAYDSVLDMMYADQTKLQYQSMNEEQKQMALTQVMMHKAEDFIVEQIKKA
ncbi:MAG: Trigger factor [Chlamydiia bacterium]|nr:Trigger factor [Chlamydiia bacterium]